MLPMRTLYCIFANHRFELLWHRRNHLRVGVAWPFSGFSDFMAHCSISVRHGDARHVQWSVTSTPPTTTPRTYHEPKRQKYTSKAWTESSYNRCPQQTKDWVPPDKCERSQSNAVPQMANLVSRTDRRMLRSTVSNAELRSRSTRIDTLPLSVERTKALWTDKTALSVEWCARYADWCNENRLHWLAWFVSRLTTTRSRT